jgi:hypothetical protein
VVRFGTERCKEGEMVDIQLLAKRRVCSHLRRGRLLSVIRELSVKSMALCWSCSDAFTKMQDNQDCVCTPWSHQCFQWLGFCILR